MKENNEQNKDAQKSAVEEAKDVLLKPERDARKVLSKKTRLLHSSETKRQAFYALETSRDGKLLSKVIGGFLLLLVFANAVLVFLSAQPDLEPITTHALNVFFVFSTFCFFLEYLARIWVADLTYGNCTRARARMKYIFSALGIIDFLSFAPSMISWVLPVTPALIHVVNVLRLIRLMKVTRYMRGFRTMERVMRKHYQEIVASFLVIIMVILVTGVVMYEVEHNAQPDKFSNLFQCIWFAVETVTSTGYGDLVPVTTLGKVCGMIIMMLSLGLIAIPGGIFSAGFVAEFQNANMRKIEHDVERNRHHIDSNNSANSNATVSASSGSNSSTDASEDTSADTSADTVTQADALANKNAD